VVYRYDDHGDAVRETARTLGDNLGLPSVQNRDLWRKMPLEFKPGTLYLSIGQVDAAEDGEIRVTLPEIGFGIAEPHLVQALLNHLSTSRDSRFVELTGDSGKLRIFQTNVNQYSEVLIRMYKLMIDSFSGTETPVHEAQELEPGLTRDFFVSAWIEIIQRATGSGFIREGWYKPEPIPGTGLLKLKCGGFDLAYAENIETLGIYEHQHKDLVEHYLEGTFVKEINVRWRELEIFVAEIKQVLIEFGDKVKLLGMCELCSETMEKDLSDDRE